jgi:hypothetical protein
MCRIVLSNTLTAENVNDYILDSDSRLPSFIWALLVLFLRIINPGRIQIVLFFRIQIKRRAAKKVCKLNFKLSTPGKSYWQQVFNMQAMADYGMIGQADVDMICYTDSVDEVGSSPMST